VIGSCTNGRIEDLRVAAGILKGRKVHPDVRLIVIPATQEIFLQSIKEGLTEIFVEAGGRLAHDLRAVSGRAHGRSSEGERAVATTNRNFVGRMATSNPKSTWQAQQSRRLGGTRQTR